MNKINKIEVFYDGTQAGYLNRQNGYFSFQYSKPYLENQSSLPISCTLPLSNEEYISPKLHSFFQGLKAQGWYRDALLHIDEVTPKDSFTLLALNGLDLQGAVELKTDKELELPSLYTEHNQQISSKQLNSKTCLICLKDCEKNYHHECLESFFNINEAPQIGLSSADFNLPIFKHLRGSSIAGMQTKIGVSMIKGVLLPQAIGSQYILKPAISKFPNSAVYEHLSMKITELILDSKVAESAVIKLADNSLAYISKRFDRDKSKGKRHFEDFSQLLNLDQFSGSYEEVIEAIKKYSTTETRSDFLMALMVQFYLGNDDFHLKNIALIDIQKNGKYKQLAPLYDCINTESLLREIPGHSNEMAIDFFIDHETPVYTRDGHSSHQTFKLLYQIAGISTSILEDKLHQLNTTHAQVKNMVHNSLLNEDDKNNFLHVLNDRLKKLNKRN